MVIFAVSFGICNGLAYTIPLKVGWDHFPNNKGLVSGIIIGGFGLGSFIFGLISTLLINPGNSKPNVKVGSLNLYDKVVADHLILSIRILILIWSILGLSGILLLSAKSTEDKNEGDSLEFSELVQD
jgi:MFS family permease